MAGNDLFIVLGIVGAFALFGLVLAWGDFYSNRERKRDRQPAE